MGCSNTIFKLTQLENCHYPVKNQTHVKLHIIFTNKLIDVQ